MNVVLSFLESNHQRLELGRHGVRGRLSSVLLTPRFRASSHAVFLVLQEGSADPVLVAKVPRLRDARARVAREVANLRAVHALRPRGFDSLPRVVVFEDHQDWPLFVQTALVGSPLDRKKVRRDPVHACELALHWLLDLQGAGGGAQRHPPDWYGSVVEAPLDHFSKILPTTRDERESIAETRGKLLPLRRADLPLTFEHGDLSHPNLLRLSDGTLGVLDWELAEPAGIPAFDLFFFLTYVAFSGVKSDDVADYQRAFHAAFFEPKAWARSWVREYAKATGLEEKWLTPLFLLTWSRHVGRLASRLTAPDSPECPLAPATAAWLRSNRYYTLWQHTLEHLGELDWSDLPRGRGRPS